MTKAKDAYDRIVRLYAWRWFFVPSLMIFTEWLLNLRTSKKDLAPEQREELFDMLNSAAIVVVLYATLIFIFIHEATHQLPVRIIAN